MNHGPNQGARDEGQSYPSILTWVPEQPAWPSHSKWCWSQRFATEGAYSATVGGVKNGWITSGEEGCHIKRQTAEVFVHLGTQWFAHVIPRAFQTRSARAPEETTLMLEPDGLNGSSVVLSHLDRIAHTWEGLRWGWTR